MIKIVDYGMGNLRSVQKAFESLGVEATVCPTAGELSDVDKMILPGVGAFRDAMTELQKRKLVQPILDHMDSGKPFLGICLGLQLLMDLSYEDGEWEGLKVIPGKVIRFEKQPELKIPHMGWNQVKQAIDHPLWHRIEQDARFYFVHSYYAAPDKSGQLAGRCHYGVDFAAALAQDNVFATQFHPEKSHTNGLQLLSNFLAWDGRW